MNKLEYMIDFIDDDSLEVREEIIKQLSDYGFELEDDLAEFGELIGPDKFNLLRPVIEQNRKDWIKENWSLCFNANSDLEKIENVLSILSKFHYGINYKPGLSVLLDELSEEFINIIPYGDELDLSYFLFQEKGIKGAKDDYNNPFNSNAVYAINEKKGLPITLSLIYVLVGNRLNYNIKGCNYPGHFLAKIDYDNEVIFVDCFNGGKIYFEYDIDKLLKDDEKNILKAIKDDTPVENFIKRILNNLVNSYRIINDIDNANFFRDLINSV